MRKRMADQESMLTRPFGERLSFRQRLHYERFRSEMTGEASREIGVSFPTEADEAFFLRGNRLVDCIGHAPR